PTMAVGAVLGLTPLKTVQPIVIPVDNNTGATDIVTTMKKQEQSYGECLIQLARAICPLPRRRTQ
ncbi:VirB8/TrbF family protein, partial [Kingella kingae]|uniref:VirB8/TrbF family protein n=1 Tax=Kingella kingae TaxID=504 RepID=UPI001E3B873A